MIRELNHKKTAKTNAYDQQKDANGLESDSRSAVGRLRGGLEINQDAGRGSDAIGRDTAVNHDSGGGGVSVGGVGGAIGEFEVFEMGQGWR